jgi:tetratricopeptide (TPR) repeat protein
MAFLLFLGGCGGMGQAWFLGARDREIESSTRAIEAARDDAHRAAAFVERGRAYSEKARYSRFFKLIPAAEYDRLFSLAVKDLDQSIALDPGSAEAYFNLGQTYYDRAVLEEGKDARKLWFDPAAANFKKAIERDGRNYVAWDRLGLVHEQNDEREQAISDYTTEMTLHPSGKARLADAYCNWGFSSQREGNYDAAVADYEKAIQVGATPDDGCSCDPYNPLVAIYTTVNHQYDKGWDVVHKAQKSGRSIATEIVEGLKKDSGRNN